MAKLKEQTEEPSPFKQEVTKQPDDNEKTVHVRALHHVTVDSVKFEKDTEGKITPRQYAALACHFVKLVEGAKALAILALLFLFTGAAHAQVYKVTSPGLTNNSPYALNGGTNNIAGASTNTYAYPIALTRYDKVTFGATFAPVSTAVANVTFYFDTSIDGTNWSTNAFVWPVSGAGYTAGQRVTVLTNISSESVGWYRLGSVGNTNSGAVTNLLFEYAVKPSRAG